MSVRIPYFFLKRCTKALIGAVIFHDLEFSKVSYLFCKAS